MGKNYKRITRLDIAKEVNVSVSVVSRALNNSGYVDDEKKQKVLEAAYRLGYKSFVNTLGAYPKRTKQIIFICGDLTGTYFNQMYHGIWREAKKRGYGVTVMNDSTDFRFIKNILADGIIFYSEEVAQDFNRTVGRNYYVPSVFASFDASVQLLKASPMVLIDNIAVINSIIDYLMLMGHKKIGYLFPDNVGYAKMRFDAWGDRMKMEIGDDYKKLIFDLKGEQNLKKKHDYKDLGDFRCESTGFEYYDAIQIGRNAADYYINAKYKPSVMICFNDDLAIGFIQGLRKHGIDVPRDLSVMGIDGIYSREHHEPRLTTMSLYPERQGAICVNVLIDMLQGKKHKYVNNSPYNIIEGETVIPYS